MDCPWCDEASRYGCLGDWIDRPRQETYPAAGGDNRRVTTPLPDDDDDRAGPAFMESDRQSLVSWLEFYRSTLPWKIRGLTPDQLCLRAVPPSGLTLLGIVRHLAKVERYWFGNVVGGVEQPRLYCEAHPEGDFADVRPENALSDLDRYHAEVAAARATASAISDLDAALPGKRNGEDINLRWIMVHMIEEYARHLGHADLLRECIDGRTGY
jgi:hypothetical protein